MNKIRTLVAHDDENVKKDIVDIIKKFDYIEVVGTASNSTEEYNKIIEYKPEFVFAKYSIDSIEILKKSKEYLAGKIPVFNIISKANISEEKIKEMYDIVGNNLNSIVSEPINNFEINNIIKTYKEFIENN